ncbi:hypothetical protein G7Z17_g9233 [Cylindrodendrum hubeiense]|uniref:Extracellular membrane protein CFEM domain-containing protein n=1 Tax=Cylindrodendrum hubeiense TaxID=595255 RepID=A0A9P5H9M7_9HYPO|nr:hypothetical protein G7Z17_g9233 [Cylindrodendrum hubeiense]
MAPRSLWSSLPLVLLAPWHALAASNDFSFYPENSQDCLYKAADKAACSGDTNEELNKCLCENTTGFVTYAAQCLGTNDPDDVDTVYTTMSGACDTSTTPIGVTEEGFKAAAAQGESSSTAASASATASEPASATNSASESATDVATTTASKSVYVTTTSGGKTVTVTATNTNESNTDGDNDSDDKKGLSTPVTIGIGVGSAVVGAALVGGLALFLLRRRRKGGEESHPMLPDTNQHQHQGSAPPYAPGVGYNDNKPAWVPGYTPSPDPSQKSWNTSTQYTGAYAPPGHVPSLPQQQGLAPGHVFEMEGSVATEAVEMPGSVMQGGHPIQQHGHPGQHQGWHQQ